MIDQVQLRPAQESILTYRSGRMGISAVPGSGKTWTLSRLAAQIVSSGVLQDDQELLVVTLVNSAVENFNQRVSSFRRCRRIAAAPGLPGAHVARSGARHRPRAARVGQPGG